MIGGGGGEVSFMIVGYYRGKVSVSSLFLMLVHHKNLIIITFLSLSEYTLFNII